jgi:hypothetical protein
VGVAGKVSDVVEADIADAVEYDGFHEGSFRLPDSATAANSMPAAAPV